jgi:ATP-binding cassette subfamily B protein
MLDASRGLSQARCRASYLQAAFDSIVHSAGLMGTVLFLWLGARKVTQGDLTVGAFVALNALAAIAGSAMFRVLRVWQQWQRVPVLLDRLNDVVEAEPEQGEDRSRLVPVRSLEGRIELRQVRFRYGGADAPEVLKGISLSFEPGTKIAIVGRSGSGKSTLVKLLAGLIEPAAGSVLLDRVELKTLNYRQVRRQIGFVLQESHIFDDTVMGNIAFGDPQPDFDRVLWASQVANAHEFIMDLPSGYESRIGESGIGLAGGLKQRIAIARALYLDPPILIFDEATSALDGESERAIQENLRRTTAGRTWLVITHRLETVRDAGLIVVLEKGEVVETGTHEQLVARRGLYFQLAGLH